MPEQTLDARLTACGRGGWGRIVGVAVWLAGQIRHRSVLVIVQAKHAFVLVN